MWKCLKKQSKVLVSCGILFLYGALIIKVTLVTTFNRGKENSVEKDIFTLNKVYYINDRISEKSAEFDVGKNQSDYVNALQAMRDASFLAPELVVSPSEEFISLGMIAINLQKTKNLPEGFRKATKKTFNSIFKYSSGTPLHLIVITNRKSLKSVGIFLSSLVSSLVSLRVILSPHWRWWRRKVLPIIKIDYVNSEKIIEKSPEFVSALKGITVQAKDHKGQNEDKYSADLFYIAPTYHRAFEALEKMIVIDISDLEFHEDVKALDEQFRNMSAGTLMGVGLDLSPNYHQQLTNYRRHNPGSRLGYPGSLQGGIIYCGNILGNYTCIFRV